MRGTGLGCTGCEAQWKPWAVSLGLRLAPTRPASCSLPQGAPCHVRAGKQERPTGELRACGGEGTWCWQRGDLGAS